MSKGKTKFAAVVAALTLGALVAGCGDSGGDETTAAADNAQLAPIKTYLTDHSAELLEQAELLQADADEYHSLAESVNFDYDALLAEHGEEVEQILDERQADLRRGQPGLRGDGGHRRRRAAAGPVRRRHRRRLRRLLARRRRLLHPHHPEGKQLKQPGNLFFLTETALYGTNPDLQAKGTQPDVNGDGEVEFGEGLPDADIFKATADEFVAQAESLDEDAQAFEPTFSDALTSIVVMTPTMSEYFEAWKNSRFIAGEDAEEQGFVATSRLSDIADILGGILFTYDGIEATIAAENPQQAKQTRKELQNLVDFATKLRDREADGVQFTAKQADALGAQAQAQAEAIAGQVTQAAKQLEVELQEG